MDDRTPLLSADVSAERAGIPLGVTTELAVVISLRAAGDAVGGPRPALSVAFVLDASGSMRGDPIAQVKDSVERLIELLAPNDQVSIVAFADNPVVVSERGPLTPGHKAHLKRRLQGVQALGGTGMTRGLQQGASALGPRGDNERQVVLLLTDGAPTDGASTESLAAVALGLRPNVSTTTLGYGPNHNADLLDGVARAGGGQYWYIPDPQDAQVEFARALGAQGDVVVDGVELVLLPSEGTEILEVLAAGKVRVSANGLVVPRPDLRSEQTHTTIVRLRIDAGSEAGRTKPLSVQVRYRRAGAAAIHNVEAALVVDVVHGEGSVNPGAQRLVALAGAEIKRASARHQADQGRFDAAAAVLRAVVKDLEALPGYAKMDGGSVSEAVEQLLDEIQAYETRPSAQQYMEFRSTNLGVDLAQGSKHAADVKAQSQSSRALMAGVVDQQVIGNIVVRQPGHADVVVPLAGELTIGRVPGNDIVLALGNISKRHTRIVARDGKVVVVDLKATNGTFVNGQRVGAPQIVGPGDKIQIGASELHFEARQPAEPKK